MIDDIAPISISPSCSLIDTIKIIDVGGLQIALVVDAQGQLLGTVTDGDIRRGLLKGVPLSGEVHQVMNTDPITLQVGQGRERALQIMRQHSIHQLPLVDDGNRAVGIELIDLIGPPAVDATVVLMAGGLGMRLRPLTETVPKPMILVGGRPLIETIIRNFEAQGFRDIYLSVNYKSEVISSHFEDGSRFGVSIKYITEKEKLGTAGSLTLLPDRPKGVLVVMNGDLLTSVNFRSLIEFHRAQGALATMCVREYSFQVPYGVVQAKESRLTEVIEKPTHNFFVNAGVYVLEPEVLDLIPPGASFDMPQIFERILAEDRPAAVFPIHEYWMDIGRTDDLERAQDDIHQVFR